MKTLITLTYLSCFSFAFGQVTTTAILNQNNASAEISDGGIFFTSGGSADPGYEIPAGSGITSMFALTYWFGGTDVNGQRKMAIPLYGDQSDLFPGPLTVSSATPANWPTSLFPVTKAEIDNHIANYLTVGYVVPSSIANWPAHGDVSLGFDYYLAPFIDVDTDGNYSPSSGDYPCILGDKAVYVINNDKGNVHASGADPIGIEVHTMFYQYNTTDDINNVTFAQVRVINRGTQTLFDYRMSVFADTDIGNYTDDYMGTDSVRNMMFAYNGDGFDEDFAGYLGYGNMPPAIGVMSLDHDLTNARSYASMSTPGDYMTAMLTPGYDFPGNPYTLVGDSEESNANTTGDRKMFYTISPGDLLPGDTYYHNYAVMFSRADTNRLQNVNQLYNIADEVQLFYDTNLDGVCVEDPLLTVAESTLEHFEIYPNPTSGIFTLNLSGMEMSQQLEITDVLGNIVQFQLLAGGNEELKLELNAPDGVYFIRILHGNEVSVAKLILSK
ncbi:MAG: hypothetical protein ACI865_003242 [Flavobacteriaceae bacterium]|jgi:hypothetical protein